MTGQGLYGQHAGYQMPVSNLLQMNVAQARSMDSDMVIAISDRPYKNGTGFTQGRWNPDNPDARLMPAFIETLGDEDERLDRMAMGLGIWVGDVRRYYPSKAIQARGKYLIDEVEGRKLLIILDPLTSTPTALYWNTNQVTIEGRDLLLDDGFKISNGLVYDSQAELVEVERPQQMYTRWYGFALTFPDSEIVE